MVLIAPPFLNEECMSQYMESVRFLAKPSARFLAATGTLLSLSLSLFNVVSSFSP